MAKIPDQLTQQKDATTFWCPHCRWRWDQEPERVEHSIASPHPYEYFATCPKCDTESNESPQLRALYHAWLNMTASKSPEISNLNLKQPPVERTRFNSLKHGMYAKKAKYFPAKVGRYPECEGCAYAAECEISGVCLEVSKIKMMVQKAIDDKSPEALTGLMKDTQADLAVLVKRIFSTVFRDGVSLESPVWAGTKDGYELVRDQNGNQVIDISAHPLLKTLIDLVQKNNLSLSDLMLTPKSAEESDVMRGHLDGEVEERQNLQQYREDRNKMLEQFLSGQAALEAGKRRSEDPIAKEAMREIETGTESEELPDDEIPELPGLPGEGL